MLSSRNQITRPSFDTIRYSAKKCRARLVQPLLFASTISRSSGCTCCSHNDGSASHSSACVAEIFLDLWADRSATLASDPNAKCRQSQARARSASDTELHWERSWTCLGVRGAVVGGEPRGVEWVERGCARRIVCFCASSTGIFNSAAPAPVAQYFRFSVAAPVGAVNCAVGHAYPKGQEQERP